MNGESVMMNDADADYASRYPLVVPKCTHVECKRAAQIGLSAVPIIGGFEAYIHHATYSTLIKGESREDIAHIAMTYLIGEDSA